MDILDSIRSKNAGIGGHFRALLNDTRASSPAAQRGWCISICTFAETLRDN